MTDLSKNKQQGNDFDDLARFGLSVLITTMLKFILRIIKNAVISRLLGPSGRGLFGLAILVPDTLVNFGHVGLRQANMYYLGKRKYSLPEIVGTNLAATLVLSSILACAGFFIINTPCFFNENFEPIKRYLLPIICAIPFLLLFWYLDSILFALKDIHFINLMDILNSLLPVLFLLGIYYFIRQSLPAAIYGWAFSAALISLCLFIRLIKFLNGLPKFSIPYLKTGMLFGCKAYIGDLLAYMLFRIDYFIISYLLNTRELGLYIISVSMAELLLTLPDTVVIPAIPAILSRAEGESSVFTAAVTRCVLAAVFTGAVIACFLGKIGIFILFGSEFLPAFTPFLFLLPGMLARSVYPVLKTEIMGRNRPGTVSLLSGTALLINIPLNFCLIPVMGISGAALSSSISYILATTLAIRIYISSAHISAKETILIKQSDIKNIVNYIKTKVGLAGRASQYENNPGDSLK